MRFSIQTNKNEFISLSKQIHNQVLFFHSFTFIFKSPSKSKRLFLGVGFKINHSHSLNYVPFHYLQVYYTR